jgi:AcrR family transcriptional regulator
MRAWVPVPGTSKARLVEAALAEFGARGFDAVGVTELAESAGVTVGALYHHFGSKAGLYDLIRDDIERRLIDRLEGAWATAAGPRATLGVGFDYAIRSGFARILAEPATADRPDPVEAFIAARTDRDGLPLGRLLAAVWRAALAASDDDPAAARAALLAVIPDPSSDQ